MATVLVLGESRRLPARYQGALARRHTVFQAPRWSALPGLLPTRRVDLLVVAPADAESHRSLEAGVAWLRRHHPDLAVLAHVDLRHRPLDAFRLGALGVDALVVARHSDGRAALLEASETALARALARSVARRLRPRADPLLIRCLARAIEGAGTMTDTTTLAEPEGVSVRSLRRELAARRLPAPGRVLRWGRHFRAAAALDRDDRSVEHLAHGLGYAAGAALSRALRRDVGHPPTILKERGGIECVLEAFLNRELATGPELVPE